MLVARLAPRPLWRRKTRARTHTHTDTIARRTIGRGVRQPLAKGCADAGVARFYLRHSSAKGVRARREIYLTRGAVFVFSSAHTHTRLIARRLCMYAHLHTRTMRVRRVQWRFSRPVPRPFKQAEEILRRNPPVSARSPPSFPPRLRQRRRVKS